MNVEIRGVELQDAEEIYNIRQMKGVMENILSYPEEPKDKVLNKIKNLTANDHWFVAVNNNKVIGLIMLSVHGNPRKKHVGHISIMIDEKFHGQGVGSRLMKYLINFSDNVLKLKRLELYVFYENARARNLYKKFGFQEEGILKCSALRNGQYSDEILMAKVN